MLVDIALIKTEVIIPPAAHVKTTGENVKQYECFDQWLCHIKL
jgi:hypothetical protein